MEEVTEIADNVANPSQASGKATAEYRTIYQHQPFQVFIVFPIWKN
jgi:hypothetical protein